MLIAIVAKSAIPIVEFAIGLFVIPMLYVTFQTIRERSGERIRRLWPRSVEND